MKEIYRTLKKGGKYLGFIYSLDHLIKYGKKLADNIYKGNIIGSIITILAKELLKNLALYIFSRKKRY